MGDSSSPEPEQQSAFGIAEPVQSHRQSLLDKADLNKDGKVVDSVGCHHLIQSISFIVKLSKLCCTTTLRATEFDLEDAVPVDFFVDTRT